MQKTITKIEPMVHNHAILHFEDGSKLLVQRGGHETLTVGQLYPPAPVAVSESSEPSAADLDAVADEVAPDAVIDPQPEGDVANG